MISSTTSPPTRQPDKDKQHDTPKRDSLGEQLANELADMIIQAETATKKRFESPYRNVSANRSSLDPGSVLEKTKSGIEWQTFLRDTNKFPASKGDSKALLLIGAPTNFSKPNPVPNLQTIWKLLSEKHPENDLLIRESGGALQWAKGSTLEEKTIQAIQFILEQISLAIVANLQNFPDPLNPKAENISILQVGEKLLSFPSLKNLFQKHRELSNQWFHLSIIGRYHKPLADIRKKREVIEKTKAAREVIVAAIEAEQLKTVQAIKLNYIHPFKEKYRNEIEKEKEVCNEEDEELKNIKREKAACEYFNKEQWQPIARLLGLNFLYERTKPSVSFLYEILFNNAVLGFNKFEPQNFTDFFNYCAWKFKDYEESIMAIWDPKNKDKESDSEIKKSDNFIENKKAILKDYIDKYCQYYQLFLNVDFLITDFQNFKYDSCLETLTLHSRRNLLKPNEGFVTMILQLAQRGLWVLQNRHISQEKLTFIARLAASLTMGKDWDQMIYVLEIIAKEISKKI